MLALLLALAAACGGGGGSSGGNGGGNGGGNATPTPQPGASPTPRPSAPPTPTASGQIARVILSENDTVAGLKVSDIEDAALNTAGAVGVIIAVRGTGGQRAVLLGDTAGAFEPLVAPGDPPPGDDLRTLGRVRLAETGAAIFESGEGLDSDRLYFASDDVVQALAGAVPGVVTPTFRILGDATIGGSGAVAFVVGGDQCTVEGTRTLCTGHLFVADDGLVTEVEGQGISLEEVSPTQPQVAVADTGVTFFSVPGSGAEPVLVRYDDGALKTVLSANSELDGVGRLTRPRVAAATADEELLLTTTLARDPGPSRPTVLGILSGTTFTVLDREREAVGDQQITDLRAVGLDEDARALYVARIGQAGDGDAPRTLRLSDGSTSVDVATERAPLPGSDKTLIAIESQRINRRGDVAFIATLGRISELTTIVDEVRAVVRLADGSYLAPVSNVRPGNIGTLSNLEIAGFDDNANLLLLATRSPSQTVLVFAPPTAS